MDWTKTTNKQKPIPEQTVQDYFNEMAADLNFRLLCETADSPSETADKVSIPASGKGRKAELLLPPKQMLWVESITVTDYEIAPYLREKNRRTEKRKKPKLKNSLREWIINCLLGRKGKKK